MDFGGFCLHGNTPTKHKYGALKAALAAFLVGMFAAPATTLADDCIKLPKQQPQPVVPKMDPIEYALRNEHNGLANKIAKALKDAPKTESSSETCLSVKAQCGDENYFRIVYSDGKTEVYISGAKVEKLADDHTLGLYLPRIVDYSFGPKKVSENKALAQIHAEGFAFWKAQCPGSSQTIIQRPNRYPSLDN